ILADPARDKSQRDLAKKALGKLGTDAVGATGAAKAPPAGTGARAPTSAGARTSGAGAAGAGATGATGAGTAGAAGAADRRPPSDSGSAGSAGSLLGDKPSSAMPALPVLPDDAIAAYERVTFAGGTANLGYDSARKRLAFDADIAGLYQKRIERETMAWGLDASAHVVAGYINPEGRSITRGAQVDLNVDGEARFYSGT